MIYFIYFFNIINFLSTMMFTLYVFVSKFNAQWEVRVFYKEVTRRAFLGLNLSRGISLKSLRLALKIHFLFIFHSTLHYYFQKLLELFWSTAYLKKNNNNDFSGLQSLIHPSNCMLKKKREQSFVIPKWLLLLLNQMPTKSPFSPRSKRY